jgi:hypothetical protein
LAYVLTLLPEKVFQVFQVARGEEERENRECIDNLFKSIISVHNVQMHPPLLNITVASPMIDNFKLIPMSDVPTTNWEDISVGSQDLANRNQDDMSCALPLKRHVARRLSSSPAIFIFK